MFIKTEGRRILFEESTDKYNLPGGLLPLILCMPVFVRRYPRQSFKKVGEILYIGVAQLFDYPGDSNICFL